MGARIAGDSRGVHSRLCPVCGQCTQWTARRQRGGFDFWSDWIWVHGLRGAVGGAEAGADLADWARTGLDARALMARTAELAGDSVSWWISFWGDADERVDVAANYYGDKRSVWRGVTTLLAADDDDGRAAGNDLRRNRKCAQAAG